MSMQTSQETGRPNRRSRSLAAAAASSVHRASSRSSGTEKSRRSWVPNSFPKQDQDSNGSAAHGSFESYVPYLFGHV